MRQLIELNISAEAQKAGTSESFRVGVRNAKGEEPAEIALYGEIGNPFEAADAGSVGQFLRQNKGRDVNVRINSMGGLAYDGITIHNALVNHDGKVTTIIEGMAGSAASIIAMAGSPVQMYENAHLFIHRALMMAIGNVDAMEEAQTWLQKVDDAIARTYKAKTSKALDKIHEMMRGKLDGTMFTAKEAVEQRFADQIISLKTGQATAAVPNFRPEAETRLHSVEAARAARIRSRRELFVPSGVAASAPVPRLPKAAGGPMYDVGDMVQVMEDGAPVGSGEIRSAMLGYMYGVMQADGTMLEDCCEDDLMPMGEEMARARGIVNTVPQNPPGGNGTGVDGTWNKLALQDFTDQSWTALSDTERTRIGKYFAWYPNLTDFGNLHLGHHYPPNHANAGKPSLAGVRNALARLNQVQGMSAQDRDRAQAHLQAHLANQE